MPPNEKTLKEQNIWKLAAFIVVNVVVLWSVGTLARVDVTSIRHVLDSLEYRDGIIGLLLPLAVVALNGVVGSTQKARLVFWRWKHPLPGSRAFTKLGPDDPRVDMRVLEQNLGELPTEPSEQNAVWYRLFRKHEEVPRVRIAHRDYLLTRDVTSLSFLFFLGFGAGILFTPVVLQVKVLYGVGMGVLYVLLRMSAKNYGERFVCTVLAEESVV